MNCQAFGEGNNADTRDALVDSRTGDDLVLARQEIGDADRAIASDLLDRDGAAIHCA